MNVLDLFSGIGGFSLGLELAEMRTVAFCEIEPFCRAVLRKHWPNVPIFRDIKHVTTESIRRLQPIDLVCGGFPCQPVSVAGARRGEADERWLWPEFARVIREVEPRWVLAENVPGLLSADRGRLFGGILRDLAALGFDVEWHCISAASVGAPHRRERVWIIGHADSNDVGAERGIPKRSHTESSGSCCDVANTDSRGCEGERRGGVLNGIRETLRDNFDGCDRAVADTPSERLEGWSKSKAARQTFRLACHLGVALGNANGAPSDTFAAGGRPRSAVGESSWWSFEPDVGRVANGIPARVDRLRSLGNAVVPQIPEIIGRAIIEIGD